MFFSCFFGIKNFGGRGYGKATRAPNTVKSVLFGLHIIAYLMCGCMPLISDP